MKRIILYVILALVIALPLQSFSEGLLPELGEVFEIDVPSFIEIGQRQPSTHNSLSDGTEEYLFDHVSEEEYDEWVDLLDSYESSLQSYNVTDNHIISVAVKIEGAEISFVYDNELQSLLISYGKGCNKDKLRIQEFGIVGAIVKFGEYEQDGNTENGKEQIEWIVMDSRDGKSLLLSRYALEFIDYFSDSNKRQKDKSWENCMLREWLNSSFLDTAFTGEEQNVIVKTEVDNSSDQFPFGIYTSSCNNTQDYIFILSIKEAQTFFEKEEDRVLEPTQYVRSKAPKGKNGKVGWWLRFGDAGKLGGLVAVRDDGGMEGGALEDCCVRPALWINWMDLLSSQ